MVAVKLYAVQLIAHAAVPMKLLEQSKVVKQGYRQAVASICSFLCTIQAINVSRSKAQCIQTVNTHSVKGYHMPHVVWCRLLRLSKLTLQL